MKKLLAGLTSAFLIVTVTSLPNQTDAQTPLQIVWKTKMKFGKVASSVDGAGAVTINPSSNTRSVSGAAFDFGGTWQRGKFQLIGDSKAYVIVTLPSSFTLTNNNGSFSIQVTDITMNRTNPIRLSNAGKKTVFIGGKVTILTNQKNKTYGKGGGDINAEYL